MGDNECLCDSHVWSFIRSVYGNTLAFAVC